MHLHDLVANFEQKGFGHKSDTPIEKFLGNPFRAFAELMMKQGMLNLATLRSNVIYWLFQGDYWRYVTNCSE